MRNRSTGLPAAFTSQVLGKDYGHNQYHGPGQLAEVPLDVSVSERLFARFSRGLFAEQRCHSLSCYKPRARGHARMKTIALFAWKQLQVASQMPFTISNEIGVYRHRLHT